jgi:hypothetical protein
MILAIIGCANRVGARGPNIQRGSMERKLRAQRNVFASESSIPEDEALGNDFSAAAGAVLELCHTEEEVEREDGVVD